MAKNDKRSKSKYIKNFGKSAKKLSADIAKAAMPELHHTAISTKDIYKDIKSMMIKERARIKLQQRYQNNTLLRPVKEIIQNAKSDIKSGKFYNKDRIEQNKASSMSEFLGMGDDENTNEYNEPIQGTINSTAFDKIIASSSAHSMSTAQAISESQLKSAEYLGAMYQTTHMQDLILSQKRHLEKMQKLDNMEKLTTSLVEFNLNQMTEHIKITHEFYDRVLNETADLKEEIHRISTNISARFGDPGKHKRKKNSLMDIIGNGFDSSAYGKQVKKNFEDTLGLPLEVLSSSLGEFKSSPISTIIKLAMSSNKKSKSIGKLDKSIQGLLGNSLRKVSGWKKGQGISDGPLGIFQQLLGGLFGVDFKASTKPDLSIYRTQAMTAELEQKKTKAITEVIPQYLSAITKQLTGKNMYYNYDKGIFEDRDKTRERIDKDRKNELVYTMSDTKKYFDSKSKAVVGKTVSAADRDIVYEDIDAFIAWLATSDIDYNPQSHKNDEKYYYTLQRNGLQLRGGIKSYKIIEALYMKASPSQRAAMKGERTKANAYAKEYADRWNEILQSSGQSALYNGFYEDKKIKNKNIKTISSYSDMQRMIMGLPNMSDDEYATFEREWLMQRDLTLGKQPSKSSNSKNKKYSLLKKALSKVGISTSGLDSISGKVAAIKSMGADALDTISERISDFGEGPILYGESDIDFFADGPAKVKVKSGKGKARPGQTSIKKQANRVSQSVVGYIDYRPYFEIIDSHLRNIATITEREIPVHITYGQSGLPVLVQDVGGVFKSGSAPDPIISPSGFSIGSKTESIAKAYRSAIDKIPDVVKGAKEKFVGLKNKIKEKGWKFASDIWSGIKEHNGNIREYFQSEDWQNKIAGIKGNISNVGNMAKNMFSTAKDGASAAFSSAGTLLGDLKQKTSSGFKKGKSIAVGAAITTAMGLGPIPGIIIGTLLSKKKKAKGDKEAEEAAKSLEQEEKKEKKKGFGKGKKVSNLIKGALFSSLLGLGPLPGIITASIINKAKSKKNKDEKEGKEMADSMSEAQEGKKGGFLGKIKRFFGKTKNIAVGAAASSLLGLGPMPGIIAGAIYNKKKYKKKANDKIEGENTVSTIEEAANSGSTIRDAFKGKFSSIRDKIASKREAKRQARDIKKQKAAEESGKQGEADRYEQRMINRAASTGDIDSLEKTTNIISNVRNGGLGFGSSKESSSGEKKERKSLFDMLGGLFSGGGLLSTLLKLAPLLLGGYALIKNINDQDFIDNQGNINKPNIAGAAGQFFGKKVAGLLSKIPGLGNFIGKWSGGSAIGFGVRGGFNLAEKDYGGAISDFAKGGAQLYKGATIFKGATLAKSVKALPKIVKGGAHAVKISKIGTTISIKIAQILKWLSQNNTVKRLAGEKIASLLASKSSSIGKHVASEIAERTAKTAGTKAAGKIGVKAIPIAGWILAGVQLVYGFVSGWNDVRNILKTAPSYNPPTGLKITSAIIKALDDATLGLLDLFSIRDNVIEFVYKLFASDTEKAELEAAQKEQKDNYNKFVEENKASNLTFEKYNKLTNKTLLRKGWDGVKKFFGFDAETLDDYKNGGKPDNKGKGFFNSQAWNIAKSFIPGYGIYNLAKNIVGANKSNKEKGFFDSAKNIAKSFIPGYGIYNLAKNIFGFGTGRGKNDKNTYDDKNKGLEKTGKSVSNLRSLQKNGFVTIYNTTYDNSTTANVVTNDVGGHGTGRGELNSINTNNARTVIRKARDILNKGSMLPGSKIHSFTNSQINRAVKYNTTTNKSPSNKNTSVLSSVGNIIKNASGNIWGNIKNGAAAGWNWFKGLFGFGSGRGETIYATGNGGIDAILFNSTKRNKSVKSKKYINKIKTGRGSGLLQPTKDGTVQPNGYGDREGHLGVDIHCPRGTPVYAVADGVIDYAEYGHTGNIGQNETAFSVRLDLDSPVSYDGEVFPKVYYTHLQSNLCVEAGQKVKKGDIIGYTGIANNSPHLHISVMNSNCVEGGHSNTMGVLNLKYNKNLPKVGNAKNCPTTETGTTIVNKKSSLKSKLNSFSNKLNLALNKKLFTPYKSFNYSVKNKSTNKTNSSTLSKITNYMNTITKKASAKANTSTKKASAKANTSTKNTGFVSRIGNAFKSVSKKIFGRGETIDGYTYYNQKDPAWADQYFGKYFGKRDTVKEGGCGPTVAAMALEHLSGRKVLPSAMSDLALASGHKIDDGGTDPGFFNTAGQIYGIDFNTTRGFNNRAIASLKNGNPVPILGNSGPYGNGSHYMLATKIKGNKVSVLDPQNRNNNKSYSISDLQDTTNASMVVSNAGRAYSNLKSLKNRKYINLVKNMGKGRATVLQPTKNGTIQPDGYGDKEGHKGVDIHCPRGTPVYAVADGTIRYAKYNNSVNKASWETNFGVSLTLDSPITYNGNTFPNIYYAHMQCNLCVKTGQRVKQGDVLGYTGVAGGTPQNPCGHLHISVQYGSDKSFAEGGHSNTMGVFNFSYNQKLPTVGNAKEKPTTETGTSEIKYTDPDSAGVSGNINVSTGNSNSNSNTSATSNGKNIYEKLLNGVIQAENSPLTKLMTGVGNILGVENSSNSSSSDQSSSYSKLPTSGDVGQRKKNVIEVFKKAGLNKSAISALMGNIEGENSSFDPNKVGDSGKALGLGQWHPDRRTDPNVDWANESSQADWMLREIQSGYPALWQSLKNASPSTINDIVKSLVYDYERPDNKSGNTSIRQGYAKKYYDTELTELGYTGSGGRGSLLFNPTVTKEISEHNKKFISYINNKNKTIPNISIPKSNSTSGIKKVLKNTLGNNEQITNVIAKNVGRGNEINSNNMIIPLLEGILTLLSDIRNSNNTIASKDFSPQIAISTPSGNTGMMVNGHQKQNIIDNIISGI